VGSRETGERARKGWNRKNKISNKSFIYFLRSSLLPTPCSLLSIIYAGII
jgi:hypothetical protein